MKWQMIFILGLLVSSLAFVNAQSNTITATTTAVTTAPTLVPINDIVDGDIACPDSADLESGIRECRENGLSYSTYAVNGCKYVQCTQRIVCPTQEQLNEVANKCKVNGLNYSFYTGKDNCTYVSCQDDSFVAGDVACESKEMLERRAYECKENGYSYSFVKGNNGCVAVECAKQAVVACASEEQLNQLARDCEKQGGTPQKYNDWNGCRNITCNAKSICMTDEGLGEKVKACEKLGTSFVTFLGADGCKQVRCEGEKKPVEYIPASACKKTVNEKGCVEIFCEDGFYSNLCLNKQVCYDLEYKKYVDAKGCTVVVWSDGREERSCPNKEIICDVIENKDGCQVTECDDGTRKEYCPTKQECKVTRDIEGCDVKTCVDTTTGKQTYYARNCGPDALQTPKIECKVYTTNEGTAKTCNNGFDVDYSLLKQYCEAAGVQFNSDNLEAGVKCPYGDNVEYVVNGTGVECLIDFGAQRELCTDGTAKRGPEPFTGPAPTGTPVPTSNPGGFDLFRFLRSIFGGN